MPIKFAPNYSITPKVVGALGRIETVKERVLHLPVTSHVLASLRETARLYTTHYSTMIEGNRLEATQVEKVVKHKGHFPGRERDEREVKGYYAALTQVEQWSARGVGVDEKMVQTLHALVMSDGRSKVKPTPYRDGQNVIMDSRTRAIVYMPPEAKDVPKLMKALLAWIKKNRNTPPPLVAAVAHYQFATIHPYYDGNGTTARLLTTLVLHLGGYDLKGLYSLEEYYARNLAAYYQAIGVGPSHNYYLARAEADITQWIEYFIEGMAIAFEKVISHMKEASQQGQPDQVTLLRNLDPKQRRVLELFRSSEIITAREIGELFGFKPRTSSQLCHSWINKGFLEVVDPSRKKRSYRLAAQYTELVNVPH